jgi:hypothetical protein
LRPGKNGKKPDPTVNLTGARLDTNVLIYALDEADLREHRADYDLQGILVVNPFLREPAAFPPT